MKHKEGYFKVIIYYTSSKHPMIIDRHDFTNAILWVNNIDNIENFKGCDRWQIQDNKGNVAISGSVVSEIKVTVDE
tara:strand:+ start:480 stop:707 length:228 start_codon:yes stop_codon:yes gene_type:complete